MTAQGKTHDETRQAGTAQHQGTRENEEGTFPLDVPESGSDGTTVREPLWSEDLAEISHKPDD
jgi:hypothetical protein